MTRLYKIVLLMVVVLVLAGCKKPNEAARVVVEYKQVANFYDYRLAPDSTVSHGASNGMFIMYKVKQIKNTGSEAASFTFDVNKISTVAPDKTSNESLPDGAILLANQNITTLTVGAGQTKVVNGCFIKQALTSNPQSLVSAQVGLIYAADSNQPVTMTNLAPNGSVAAVGNALPNPLQTLCSSN
jgi:hypothetical protein